MAADLVAAVTAAGESTRMGGFPKPLLTFDGRRFVERLVDTYARVGVEPVVVLGHEASEVRARADLSDATVRENPAYERGMLSSVRVAVEYARQRDANGVLLNPVDCPLTPPAVVETVAAAAEAGGDVLVPTADGGRGHPPLFAASAFDALLDAPDDRGARAVVRADDTDTREVPVNDERIFADVDTPGEYWDLVKRYEPV
ncbi:nucleotidyltransferase family protein [Halobellus limi]|uniref:Molybdenum cofactor cytidylyltransferase n=1 Tax=Halobellus limi TaxID=699433 RepID=A0A1H5U7A5_9EURY|nr:nucleotidyltransferase family protein [Halobellus limi]QCC47139.1 nucleotidyltransferase family protein [Halobellus limi]SEF70167.1 molybdenum cofactor cytidylyltransferase [Halobellus limi]